VAGGTERLGGSIEPLEPRRLLASLSGLHPAIQGRVFVDSDSNSAYTAGEELQGVSIELYQDDGDGVFERGTGDAQVGAATTTDATGIYCFDDLNGALGYFVYQPAQTVGSETLAEISSSLVQPGLPDLLIDDFENPGSEPEDADELIAGPPPEDTKTVTKMQLDETHVLGRERDLFAQFDSGSGEFILRVDRFDASVLQFSTTGGVAGNFNVTWDGEDTDASNVAINLNGRDLTEAGVNTGLGLQLGVDPAGATDVVIRLYQGNSATFSEASAPIPVTDGSAQGYLFIPFSSFTGTVLPTDVDAIQLIIETNPSADGEIASIGAVGPKTADFLNATGTDLSITKTTPAPTVTPGSQVQYTITVANNGPSDVTGATVQDSFDTTRLSSISYTSAATGTVSGNTSGTGDISDTVDMAAGSSVVYTVTAIVLPDAAGNLVNTATVDHPDDTNATNDSATVTNPLRPRADLSVAKSDGVTTVADGATVTYQIDVTNNGPSNVVGATVVDTFPSGLTNVSYTSTTMGGTVTGNTSGTGNISDTVNMALGSSIRYTVTATVDANGATQISNSAAVSVPAGTDDSDPTNNTAQDVDDVTDEFDLALTKTDNTTTAVPGQTVQYVIEVSNSGPTNVTAANVTDNFPAALTNVTYTTQIVSGTVTGLPANGTGNINHTLNLSAGSLVRYTVNATVSANATGALVNTATVTANPAGPTETNTQNNSETDTDLLQPNVDLAITKTAASATVARGGTVNYTIVVRNNGPSNVLDAPVTDTFPNTLTGVSFTSTATGGASGNTLNGTGNISDMLDLPVGAQVTYAVQGTVAQSAQGQIANTANVAAPTGVVDTNNANNTSLANVTISDVAADLSITKTDNRTNVTGGQQLTYTITVTNNGPDAVTGARIQDTFNSDFTNVTFTSTATNGATGNTASGQNGIDDTVNMPANSTIVYTVNAQVVENTDDDEIVNTASVTAANVNDPNTANNTSTDTDTVDAALAQLSGFVYLDADNDGVFDANETPLSGVTINLRRNNAQVSTATTDASGAYSFDDLDPGTYDVVEVQPALFSDGRETVGGGIGSTTQNDTFSVPLAAGDNATGLNFGERTRQPSKRDLLASSFRG
jgi:uncharacterized repeat protein (TIGR01451 family)